MNNESSRQPFGLKAKILLICLGLAFGLVAGEIALEIIKAPQVGQEFENIADLQKAMLEPDVVVAPGQSVSLKAIIQPHLNEKVIYDLRPNLDVTFQKVNVRTNSCGMRGPEIALVKNPEVFRIALLGDSFAFGWGVDSNKSFAQVIEDTLNRVSNGKPRFEVINLGVPGYSTFQEVGKLEEVGLEFNPDAVLVYFIQNDFGLPFFVRDVNNPSGILSGLEFARLSWKMLDPDIEEERVRLMGLDPSRSLRHLSDITRELGIPLMVAMNPSGSFDKDRQKLWILKKRPDIQFLDIRHALKQNIETNAYNPKDLSLSDDPHPSALKHKILGQILASYFLYAIDDSEFNTPSQ